MEYTDVEFEEEFVIIPPSEPYIGWILLDENEAKDYEQDWKYAIDDHARRARERAVKRKFANELLSVATLTGRSVAELTALWADMLVTQVKQSGSKLSDVSQAFKERLQDVIHKKTVPEVVLNPNAYKDVEPCFPPARVV